MLRYRRYRVFVVFAVISIIALYHFGRLGSWNTAKAIGAGSLKQFGLAPTTSIPQPAPEIAEETRSPVGKLAQEVEEPYITPAPVAQEEVPTKELIPSTSSTALAPSEPTAAPDSVSGTKQEDVERLETAPEFIAVDDPEKEGQGRKEVSQPSHLPVIHWTKQPEHFPVSSTIQLPSGTPKPIPRIQHEFTTESSTEQEDRLQKLKAIKDAASHAWAGYKEYAWLADEVRPVTGGKRDPFCGWAATLVDSLDTLWIMGLKDDFEEAVKGVEQIDFTTSKRKDLPLFEVTIRYLGGLLAAYDISGGQYKVLLDKAVELAEVLMGAFDTPNRMPMTYYHWMPTFASQPHRAGVRVVLAEIGSLNMEFTRLAQLTKEAKYYDAVARITDAFEEWQNREENGTLVDGMWPIYLDASGCEKPMQIQHSMLNGPQGLIASDDGIVAGEPVKAQGVKPGTGGVPAGTVDGNEEAEPLLGVGQAGVAKIAHWGDPLEEGSLDNKGSKDKLLEQANAIQGKDSSLIAAGEAGKAKIAHWGDPLEEGSLDDDAVKSEVRYEVRGGEGIHRRQLVDEANSAHNNLDQSATHKSGQELSKNTKSKEQEVCIPRGLDSTSKYGSDQFTLGAMSDSTYEYLPKQYLLLGGLEPKYRTMYEKAIDAATRYLLYRPMTPDNQDILFSGDWRAFHEPGKDGEAGKFKAEGQHLTCFAGGMYAMGAKLFGRDRDLELGAKLTEGCVWAYNVTATGIMPEALELVACDDAKHCRWNETKYWEVLDPWAASRTAIPDPTKQQSAAHATAAPEDEDESSASSVQPEIQPVDADFGSDSAYVANTHYKRQIELEDDDDDFAVGPAKPPSNAGSPVVEAAEPVTSVTPTVKSAYTPAAPLSHEEFVKKKIHDERLPPGFAKITNRMYILR